MVMTSAVERPAPPSNTPPSYWLEAVAPPQKKSLLKPIVLPFRAYLQIESMVAVCVAAAVILPPSEGGCAGSGLLFTARPRGDGRDTTSRALPSRGAAGAGLTSQWPAATRRVRTRRSERFCSCQPRGASAWPERITHFPSLVVKGNGSWLCGTPLAGAPLPYSTASLLLSKKLLMSR